MGETTGIGWTDHTANFWWGCQRVSPGCEHCYAEQLAVVRRRLDIWGPPKTTERKYIKAPWTDVPKWNAAAREAGVRRRLFVSSMADIFEDHPQVAPWRAEALELLAACTSLDVQLLTKRPENVRAMVPPSWLGEWPSWPSHIWMGTTVEDQKRADQRIPELLKIPARIRFLSCEPLLEAVDLTRWVFNRDVEVRRLRNGPAMLNSDQADAAVAHCGIAWVIVGGESGTNARPFNLGWARSIVGQCDDARVMVFVKQLGDYPVLSVADGGVARQDFGRHGDDSSLWPVDLQRQVMPV